MPQIYRDIRNFTYIVIVAGTYCELAYRIKHLSDARSADPATIKDLRSVCDGLH